MSLKLTLHTVPQVPMEADALTPERMQGMSAVEAAKLPLLHGNQKACVGDFFDVAGTGDELLQIAGDLGRVKHVGAAMSRGRLEVDGNVGLHLGSAMTGGEILVNGNAGDWVGPEMSGGSITIKGNAGHMVGSVHRGGTVGMRGGQIIVHGNAGNEAGNGMRNGLIAIGGNTGDFTGVNLRAGTIVVLGQLGARSGPSMLRGSIVSLHNAELPPTFTYSCTYRPVFLRVYLLHLRDCGLDVDDAALDGAYNRYCGDSIEMNRGEVLLLQN